MKSKMRENSIFRLAGALVGCFIYSMGINLFIIPENMYSGGIMGICQLINHCLTNILGFSIGTQDLTGIIYYLINIPIIIIGWKSIGKKFMVKTIICATAVSVFLSIIPIPQVALLENDVLANCIIGGICTGVGEGISLYFNSCMGGLDIIGILITKRKKDFSIGKVYLIVNAALYAVCLFLFDMSIVIYSLIVSAVNSFAMDRVHIQNINVEAKVITKNLTKEMQQEIMDSLYRGITRWEAKGAYTEEDEFVFDIVMSKYEVDALREIVLRYDPKAFIIVNEKVSVDGNFIKKL